MTFFGFLNFSASVQIKRGGGQTVFLLTISLLKVVHELHLLPHDIDGSWWRFGVI